MKVYKLGQWKTNDISNTAFDTNYFTFILMGVYYKIGIVNTYFFYIQIFTICIIVIDPKMSQPNEINQLLKNGLRILNNVDDPNNKTPKTTEYIDEGYRMLREAGTLIADINPELNAMIAYVHANVDQKDHCKINHAFSGIAEWQC